MKHYATEFYGIIAPVVQASLGTCLRGFAEQPGSG